MCLRYKQGFELFLFKICVLDINRDLSYSYLSRVFKKVHKKGKYTCVNLKPNKMESTKKTKQQAQQQREQGLKNNAAEIKTQTMWQTICT